MDILNVTEQVEFDNTIVNAQLHNYQPFIPSKYDLNDEIRIGIQELDTYTLPSESYLYFEGKLLEKSTNKPSKNLKFINNGIAFLLREVRFELNGVTLDSVRNVGLTSTLKNYLSFNNNESKKLHNAGWYPNGNIPTDVNGNFNVCIPLKMMLGFFEDYRKIILNMKQELILIRNNDDSDAVISTVAGEEPKVIIDKIFWRVPHIQVDIAQQLNLTKIIDRGFNLPIAFRSWELIEYPALPETTRHTWLVKTTTKLETPRHIILAFQTNKKGKVNADMSKFNNCNLSNVRVFLNSERYPYNDLYLNFKDNKYSSLFEMFSSFQKNYYYKTNEPIFTPEEFAAICPITYIDCTRQKETIQSGSIVLRIEFETLEKISPNTAAYCLILHDRLFEYNPQTKIVMQV